VPAVPVVVLSASEDPADMTRAIDSGAMGFIPKSQSSQVMIGALRLVLAGGVYLPPEAIRRAAPGSPSTAQPSRPTSWRDIGLTERQAEVLALLVQGKPNKLICRDLDLAEGTVKIHITAILKALKVTNRTQAVIEVSRLGLRLPAKH
jgi:DNA-binding NarL/FixJ family response regulator